MHTAAHGCSGVCEVQLSSQCTRHGVSCFLVLGNDLAGCLTNAPLGFRCVLHALFRRQIFCGPHSGMIMADEDSPAATEELQDEVAAMGLEPKPEDEIDGQTEVSQQTWYKSAASVRRCCLRWRTQCAPLGSLRLIKICQKEGQEEGSSSKKRPRCRKWGSRWP